MKTTPILAIAIALAVGALARAADVKDNWDKHCLKCHGTAGKGDTKMGKKVGVKDLTDAKIQSELTDERIFKSIKEGIKEGEKTKMKPAENLADDEIKALVSFVRTLKK